MLPAEELLLLALDDRSGRIEVGEIDKGLAGAVLLELALLDRVRVAEKGEQVRAERLVLRPGPAPSHPVLGLFPTRRLPAQDVTHEATVRSRILAALSGTTPDERTAALIALLSALHAVTTVFEVPDKRAARRRAKEIAEGQWAATAVRKAVEAVYAATAAATMPATTAATTS